VFSLAEAKPARHVLADFNHAAADLEGGTDDERVEVLGERLFGHGEAYPL
jgi:hypothetical protein